MDPELALLIVESDLLGGGRVAPEHLGRFSEAVVSAATIQGGYSGVAWKGGAKLTDAARGHGRDPSQFFSGFGWDALANGVHAGLRDCQILSALSYAAVPFLQPAETSSIFDHPKIDKAVRTGLDVMPRPFVKPAELSATVEEVQAQFGELLSRLRDFGADSELILQWSASALRVLSPQSQLYQTAAISLLETLCHEGRIAAAYYAFRAMAEQRDGLWDHPVVFGVLQSLIDRYREDTGVGAEVLTQLCVDDDIVRRLDQRFDLLVVVGALAINRARRAVDDWRAGATAWRLVNEVFGTSPMVANALSEYLTEGSLPALPACRADQIETLDKEFQQALAAVERSMGPRKYKTLAMRIYQSNVQDIFTPMLDRIRSGSFSPRLVDEIRELDPEELVTDSEWLQTAPHPMSTKVLRKMSNDNQRTISTLELAAESRIRLDEAKTEWAKEPGDELELFQEFDLIVNDRNTTAQWALRTLLPDFYTRLREGLSVANREMEARNHATREH